jgi:HSP90 family molecular chaperone
VITKKKNDICYRWTSDGSGMYDIEEFEGDCGFERGTKVIIHLRPNMTQFTKIESVKSIINKHSGFINYDIYINGEKNTQIGALWTKDKREITDE